MSQTLTYRKIFFFWLPLASTWLMMAFEGPYLSAIIARMAEPKYNLAAYGVAFSFALIFESPVIMMMSASTALVKDSLSFLKLRKFNFLLGGSLTLLLALFLQPDIFYFFSMDLVNLPENVAKLTHNAVILLLPWPGSIAYRRFYQGILINNKQTIKVALGTGVRVIAMSSTGILLYSFTELDGASVGAAALSAGVTSEAIITKFMVRSVINNLMNKRQTGSPLSFAYISKYYYPLALTSLLSLGVQPLVTFFIGSSRMAIESLAVLPVITSLIFIFRSVGLSYQEVGIALIGENKSGYKKLRNFAVMLASVLIFISSLIGFTPLSALWFEKISGLSKELSGFSLVPYRIIAVMPALTVFISFQRAMVMISKKTSSITGATISEVSGIVIIMLIMLNVFDSVGAVAATTAFIIGRLSANTYLMKPYRQAVKNFDRAAILK